MVLLPRLRRAILLSCLLSLLWFFPTCGQSQSLDSVSGQKFHTVTDWNSLVASLATVPQNVDTRRQAEEAVESGLPDQIQTFWAARLPVDSAPLPDSLGLQITPHSYLPTPTAEPQHGTIFPHVTYFYVPTPLSGTDQLLCRLHYLRDSDTNLAIRMGALLTLLHRTLMTEMGGIPYGGNAPFDVWLSPQGQAGGDEWHRNIYFYDLDTPRSSIEWIREIAHEYGHMALPPIGGYTAPEYWANGYYGERLLVRWLARIPGDPALVERVWGDFSGWPNFERLLITPAITLYKSHGPDASLAARKDQTGMRYLIGQILVCDDKYGGKALAEAFSYLPHARAAFGPDFGTAVGLMLAQQARHGS
jgi:hypothetical protein